jgi:hypothetical protein
MSAHTHTPGPWVATNCGSHIQVHREGWPRDAWSVCSFGFQANDKANANLVAASPDLLAALKGLMQRAVKDAEKYAQNGNEPIWAYISDASDAIAKAEGVK